MLFHSCKISFDRCPPRFTVGNKAQEEMCLLPFTSKWESQRSPHTFLLNAYHFHYGFHLGFGLEAKKETKPKTFSKWIKDVKEQARSRILGNPSSGTNP